MKDILKALTSVAAITRWNPYIGLALGYFLYLLPWLLIVALGWWALS